jgi:hypothetical protein
MYRLLTLLTLTSTILLSSEGGLLKVDWSKIVANQQKPQVISEKLKKRIAEVTLPVYMPKYYIYEKNIFIVTNPNFYTITITLDGAKVMILGDRTYQLKVSSKDKRFKSIQMKLSNEKFIQAEGISSMDFQRHGVNYSLAVECDNPESDFRCKDHSFLKKLYNRLVLIGGKR